MHNKRDTLHLEGLILLSAAIAIISGSGIAGASKSIDTVKDRHLASLHPISIDSMSANQRDEEGVTVLMWASAAGDSEAVRLLLNSGAYIDARDPSGKSAIDYAEKTASENVIGLLLSAKAKQDSASGSAGLVRSRTPRMDNERARELTARSAPPVHRNVEARDENGFTPLMVASGRGDTGAVLWLLFAKASVNAQDNIGQTALHYAALTGQNAAAQILLGANAGADIKSGRGVSALMIASGFGQGPVVKSLLDNDVNVNARDNDGHTALMFAAIAGKEDVVKILLAANADANARDRFGETAATLAAFARQEAVLRIFKDGTRVSALTEK